jgi:hypothetical protein
VSSTFLQVYYGVHARLAVTTRLRSLLGTNTICFSQIRASSARHHYMPIANDTISHYYRTTSIQRKWGTASMLRPTRLCWSQRFLSRRAQVHIQLDKLGEFGRAIILSMLCLLQAPRITRPSEDFSSVGRALNQLHCSLEFSSITITPFEKLLRR